jgi:ATP-dependent Clp protease ATP-binding subunit ClpA
VPVRLDYFSPEAQEALDSAKQAVPEGSSLTVELLLAAAYHVAGKEEELPQLAACLPAPAQVRPAVPEQVPVEPNLTPVLGELARDDMVTIDELMAALVRSAAGHTYLSTQGISEDELRGILSTLTGHEVTEIEAGGEVGPAWRLSPERESVMGELSTYGRMLTAGEPPQKGIVEMDRYLRGLQKNLIRMRRPSIIIIGSPGTGKTALVYELARRMLTGDSSVLPALRDRDIFELSPSFLRSGASVVGQYDERVSSLIKTLEANPKIILFVDEVHSLLQSGVHERGPFTEANESFKQAIGRGSISMIGATTTAEYRAYIAPDGALARRFGLLRIEPPSREDTIKILHARLPQFETHYPALRIPDEMLARTVELTEDLLPTRFQPDKSLELLDEACALCSMQQPPAHELTDEILAEALQDSLGHTVVRPGTLTIETVLGELRSKIVGQDEAMEQLATSFVAAFSEDWQRHDGPRGIFFFCGPTGVGKTETALALSKILGGGREALVRVDCNTIPGAGYEDPGPVINRLLGVPPGYIGYVRGEGGVLSKVRDHTDCIVLFDEIEKAHPGVGKILLQILDEGRVYDTDSNLLDFRRSFIVFTTNAGCTYESTKVPVGFPVPGRFEANAAGEAAPKVSVKAVQDELRQRGYGEEFLGRNIDYIVFGAMKRDDIEVVLRRQLDGLQETAELRGFKLEYGEDVFDHLASEWQPRFGVRQLTTILRHRIVEQLAIAEVQDELNGVTSIRLEKMPTTEEGEPVAGLAARKREGETMVIYVA